MQYFYIEECVILYVVSTKTVVTYYSRDERPPQSSSPGGAVNTAANRRWIPPSTNKRDALKPIFNDRNDAIFRKVRGLSAFYVL